MGSSRDEILPQNVEMRDRVNAKTSAKSGHLEDQTFDIDARTLALLGKKQRLRVNILSVTPVCEGRITESLAH